MKLFFYSLLIFIFINYAFADETKQENILKIERFKEDSKIIQSPMDGEKKEERIFLEKPKQEIIQKAVDRKISEAIELKNTWKIYEEGKFKEAAEKFRMLLKSSDREISLSSRLGLAYSLKNQNNTDEALENFEYLYMEQYKTQEVASQIVDLLIMKGEFDRAEKYAFKYCINPFVFFENAKKIKALNAKDKSKEKFLSLLPCTENDRELRLGIFYELMSMLDEDQMLQLIEKDKIIQTDREYLTKLSQIEVEIYRKKLNSIEISSPQIENIAKKILQIIPEDKGAKTTLAWHYYNFKEYDKALKLFLDLHEKFPNEEDYLLGIAYCYNALSRENELIELIEKSNISSETLNTLKAQTYIKKADQSLEKKNYSQAFSIIRKLSQQKDLISKQKAAQWYCKQGFPLLSSHTDPLNKDNCYYREQFPHFELEVSYRNKSGDRGFSRLRELSFPLSFHYPTEEGQKFSLKVHQRHVYSGSAGDNPYMGKYYEYLNGKHQINKPITEKWLWYPEVSYEIEGYPHIILSIGTTPFNGTVSPMPLFALNVDYREFWFNLHQSSVEESILSIQGQRDPYSNAKWGRVLKTGAQGGLNFSFSDSYWLAVSTGIDFIWGKNLWQNYSLEGNISFGRTYIIDEIKELDLGIFYVIKHFRRNSNFFTYGHGGYFSPQIFHMAGPTFRYKVKDCCGISFDFRASIGYIYYRSDSSPHYPKFSENETFYNASAIDDIRGKYESERKSKFGGTVETRFKQTLTKSLSLYGYGKGNVSGGYNEWNLGAGLIYYFLD